MSADDFQNYHEYDEYCDEYQWRIWMLYEDVRREAEQQGYRDLDDFLVRSGLTEIFPLEVLRRALNGEDETDSGVLEYILVKIGLDDAAIEEIIENLGRPQG